MTSKTDAPLSRDWILPAVKLYGDMAEKPQNIKVIYGLITRGYLKPFYPLGKVGDGVRRADEFAEIRVLFDKIQAEVPEEATLHFPPSIIERLRRIVGPDAVLSERLQTSPEETEPDLPPGVGSSQRVSSDRFKERKIPRMREITTAGITPPQTTTPTSKTPTGSPQSASRGLDGKVVSTGPLEGLLKAESKKPVESGVFYRPALPETSETDRTEPEEKKPEEPEKQDEKGPEKTDEKKPEKPLTTARPPGSEELLNEFLGEWREEPPEEEPEGPEWAQDTAPDWMADPSHHEEDESAEVTLPPDFDETNPPAYMLVKEWWLPELPEFGSRSRHPQSLINLMKLIERGTLDPTHEVRKGNWSYEPAGYYADLVPFFRKLLPGFQAPPPEMQIRVEDNREEDAQDEENVVPSDGLYDWDAPSFDTSPARSDNIIAEQERLRRLAQENNEEEAESESEEDLAVQEEAPRESKKRVAGPSRKSVVTPSRPRRPPPVVPTARAFSTPTPREKPVISDEDADSGLVRRNMLLKATQVGLWSGIYLFLPFMLLNLMGFGLRPASSTTAAIVVAMLAALIRNFLVCVAGCLLVAHAMGFLYRLLPEQRWGLLQGVVVGGGVMVCWGFIIELLAPKEELFGTALPIFQSMMLLRLIEGIVVGLVVAWVERSQTETTLVRYRYGVPMEPRERRYVLLAALTMVAALGFEVFGLLERREAVQATRNVLAGSEGIEVIDLLGRSNVDNLSEYIITGTVWNKRSEQRPGWSFDIILYNSRNEEMTRGRLQNKVFFELRHTPSLFGDFWSPLHLSKGQRKALQDPAGALAPREKFRFRVVFEGLKDIPARFEITTGEDDDAIWGDIPSEFAEDPLEFSGE
jgi:hypothetical protein